MSDNLSDLHLPAFPLFAANRVALLLPEAKYRGREAEAPSQGYPAYKPWVEFVLAAVLFVLTAPVVFLSALLVKLTSRGPAFYTQFRIGRHGRPYTIYKLRTMVENSESGTGV